ncbi:GIY-YIG nuclease family protein [Aerococcus agrisoli]|uniref:GIY-YIG nuclease family protein n=1 Tax=Aerococcus agrisoli TaxID=2487350 RepID=A0A3N4H6R0_9LACT|nr:GIY-YIG nuclease family protein [Aerococcus agrisoli]RPA60874.1 GIY-YIG nuclease family protein [Aerococcus agrisoli]
MGTKDQAQDKKRGETKPEKLHYFYVLACSDNTLYTGYTTDPTKREAVHNSGKGAKYTQPDYRRPVHMLYSKAFTSKSKAMSAEYRFKQFTRREKENFLRDKGIARVWPPTAWTDRVDEGLAGSLTFMPDDTTNQDEEG